ncbi:hypothetical protein [Acinetobacter baumannii]|uniref:hypothetical protein n=2 Tax=Acinetobacter baumannii TaxID=470 RepID=UPI0005F8C22E|nr:hypothetical protein [Acinetobacter baumannii]EIM5574080.1 hypothetical protein [Acinetobacter baumannii]EIO1625659.1 hypothetical protein [Acinetobacter baumannii]EKU5930110.1 hypothetical protein [Acinetobacter baumannii]EKV2371227.1 hypothetical protein [Acinetobacter baumannii]EKW4876956.1 hypothetical protein [Acinetobacter baumannii]
MNLNNSELKSEFLKILFNLMISVFTAVIVIVLGSKNLITSLPKLPNSYPLIASYSFTLSLSLVGLVLFCYLLKELFLKRMIEILDSGKFSTRFYILTSLGSIGLLSLSLLSVIETFK